ncbi:Sideroflexin-2 [Armadillidium nasatum]|uniref:Sidoreflexin n=1 Tax=Armadillidium nasatum TaxID=96803 RepID=A0A5N5SXE9_9CRUS|nr:Sideroflexin-2 [Armadillidium nasatum]
MKINIDEPQYDQNTFYGRFLHFLHITDPRLVVKTEKELMNAKELLDKYRDGREPIGTTKEELLSAKYIYESAFHPDTGEKQNIFGRMSFQVPGGMVLTGAMLSFYRSNSAVIFWQWLNQSFNALVNYTNRNANSPLTTTQMGIAYLTATSTALGSALGLKKYLSTRASPFFQRFVPFVAVAAANCANIPLMRQTELTSGIAVFDEEGNRATHSKVAAVKGISEVGLSRIAMAAPGMILLPFLMEAIEKRKLMKNPNIIVVFQTFAVGAILCFMTPTACALFNQKCSISSKTLQKCEQESYKELQLKYGEKIPKLLYFNKGL